MKRILLKTADMLIGPGGREASADARKLKKGNIEGECSFKGKMYVKRVKTKAKSLRKQ
jgi:hypothetical protein